SVARAAVAREASRDSRTDSRRSISFGRVGAGACSAVAVAGTGGGAFAVGVEVGVRLGASIAGRFVTGALTISALATSVPPTIPPMTNHCPAADVVSQRQTIAP